MRKLLVIVGVIAAAVAIGIFFAWISTRGPAAPLPPKPPVDSHTEPPRPPVKASRTNTTPTVGRSTHPPVRTGSVSNRTATPVVMTPTTNVWDDKLEEILTSDIDDTNKVKQLFEMFPHLPPEGQAEVAQHLSNLVEDEDYAPLGQVLTNATLSEDVLEVLMGDLLNRPNNIKLPMFLDIARNAEHPKASAGTDMLE